MSEAEILGNARSRIRSAYLADEQATVESLVRLADLSSDERQRISAKAVDLVERVRQSGAPTMMEGFLAEYGLSTREGVALMCLAEALLRVPDVDTIDALIEDKIAPGEWGKHLGQSSSSLVNASTWALMLTGTVIADPGEEGVVNALRGVVRRLGEPVVRRAVGEAMKELGRQFVLGRTIDEAVSKAETLEQQGYTHSYDMLGEAAMTGADAQRYHLAYSQAIGVLAGRCQGRDIRDNPGISVKLSALHPRFEFSQRDRVMAELVPRVLSLASLAQSAGMGFNIDAEEMDRLDLTLDVFEAVLSDPSLAGWDGFGVVVQTYGPRAVPMVDWLYDLAHRLDRRVVVRLVKGAYWDSEIKRAQVLGIGGYPVFTRKANSDVAYIACAKTLLAMTDRIYPQFATHNAHSAAAVLALAGDDRRGFEFQRLHGMGESLHDIVLKDEGTRCRIYAPVGAHRDLLAYLVRRLLENGSNSSFVNQIVDKTVGAEEIAHDPMALVESYGDAVANPVIPAPSGIFGPGRRNAKGWDLTDPVTVEWLDAARNRFRGHRWSAGPAPAAAMTEPVGSATVREIRNPARPGDIVGTVTEADSEQVAAVISSADTGFEAWSGTAPAERAARLEAAADLYEKHAPELMALATREAGKTLLDAVGEVREAVDFLRYYANQAKGLGDGRAPIGPVACISPWNFPLAIFTGQIAGALAAGNTVVAKPAEQTPLIAQRAVDLMHEAGVPENAVQLLPGDGPSVGRAVVCDPRIAGVCFTGSTETAQAINRDMAEHLAPDAPLIAETGGLNAMIVDSSALPEQAVRDIIASAFQSAGQRCSALRILYVQEAVEARILEMLGGAMDELRLGDPWDLATDIGPVIDEEARGTIAAYCRAMEDEGRLLKKLEVPEDGLFVAPQVFRVTGIEDLEREVFGPVLHVATFAAAAIDAVVDAVNAKGYGLTMGLHTRVDDRVQKIVERARAGNLYVNRNQIGAVVGSQPFGGEGLSGTGPKAGGPHYVNRFLKMPDTIDGAEQSGGAADVPADAVSAALSKIDMSVWSAADRDLLLRDTGAGLGPVAVEALSAAAAIEWGVLDMPGPTGESNRYSVHPRGIVLCLGPTKGDIVTQTVQALALGNGVVAVGAEATSWLAPLVAGDAPVAALDGHLEPAELGSLHGFTAVAFNGGSREKRSMRRSLADRTGALVPMISGRLAPERYVVERHLCVDTTAAGGNASLLTEAGSQD